MAEPLYRPPCPVCGAPMRRYGRGATLRKHGPQWVCPVAEAEEYTDERGHIKRRADARHDRIRYYRPDQLAAPNAHSSASQQTSDDARVLLSELAEEYTRWRQELYDFYVERLGGDPNWQMAPENSRLLRRVRAFLETKPQ